MDYYIQTRRDPSDGSQYHRVMVGGQQVCSSTRLATINSVIITHRLYRKALGKDISQDYINGRLADDVLPIPANNLLEADYEEA